MNPAEAQVLRELCRTLDVLDRLNAELAAAELVTAGGRANPLLREVVEQRKILISLHRRLALPDDRHGEALSGTRAKVARSRWQRPTA